MPTTLTGPRSFKATVTPRRCRVKSHRACSCEQPDPQTFDAADAVGTHAQRALFADYAQAAKAAVATPRRDPRPWGNIPQFTEPAHTAQERKFLGKSVGFRPGAASHFSPVAGGKADWPANTLHGVVWSRSPYGPSFWVYVEGQGFYSVREDALRQGVNA